MTIGVVEGDLPGSGDWGFYGRTRDGISSLAQIQPLTSFSKDQIHLHHSKQLPFKAEFVFLSPSQLMLLTWPV